MDSNDFDSILDECLALLAEGESVDSCLSRYPQHAAALQPLLDVAAGLHALPHPEPSADAVQAGRQRMLAAHREQTRARDRSISSLSRLVGRLRDFFLPAQGFQMRHTIRLAIALLLVLFVGTNLAVVASAGSIPGDPLYGVKRSWEEARLALTLRERDREQLMEQLVERRQAEVREMLREGREGTLDLEGILIPLEDGRWSVDNLTLSLTGATIVEGALEPGATAWVRAGVRTDGSLIALRVRVRTRPRPSTMTGSSATPDDMPNGRHMPTTTPSPQRTLEPRRSPQATRTPSPIASPWPVDTREPESFGEVVGTPEPTATQEPDDTPAPSWTDEGDRTPAPTEPGEDDHMPELTETSEPDDTPEPPQTPELDHTPEPTGEPHGTPEATEEPRRTPEVTAESQRTPEATAAPHRTSEPTAEPRQTPELTGEPQHWPEPTAEPEHTPEPAD